MSIQLLGRLGPFSVVCDPGCCHCVQAAFAALVATHLDQPGPPARHCLRRPSGIACDIRETKTWHPDLVAPICPVAACRNKPSRHAHYHGNLDRLDRRTLVAVAAPENAPNAPDEHSQQLGAPRIENTRGRHTTGREARPEVNDTERCREHQGARSYSSRPKRALIAALHPTQSRWSVCRRP